MSSVAGVLQSLGLSILVFVSFLRMLASYLWEKQAQLLYYPDQPYDSRTELMNPADYGIRAERLEVLTEDRVKLLCYFIYNPHGASDVTIVHFHGNAGNIGHRLPMAEMFTRGLRVNLVLAEYRGYGLSDDAPGGVNEAGLMKDAIAVIDHVRALPYVNPEGIIVHGSSLGGAVAVDLAANHPTKLRGVMLENTFTSISDMGDVLFKSILAQQGALISPAKRAVLTTLVLSFLKPICIQIHWRSIDKIGDVKIPILFLSGTHDELVPPEHMARLYAKCRSEHKKLTRVVGGAHNDTYRFEETFQSMREFIDEYVGCGGVSEEVKVDLAPPPAAANAAKASAPRAQLRSTAGRSSDACDGLV